MILTADRKYVLNGVTVNEFLITDHNDNRVPIRYNMKGNRIGITVHNTPRLSEVAKTQAEQYARATYNNNMDGVIVHFYVDEIEAWQLLPLDISGFHAADGNGPGNRRTIGKRKWTQSDINNINTIISDGFKSRRLHQHKNRVFTTSDVDTRFSLFYQILK